MGLDSKTGAWSENWPGAQNPLSNTQVPEILKLMSKLPGGGLGVDGGGGSSPFTLLSAARPGVLHPGQGGGGIPGGSSGGASMIPAPQAMTSTAPPQIPYVSQEGFYTSGQRKQALVADSIASIFNMVGNKKQQNEQKQYLEAENTWNQLLAANSALQQNPNDQQAHAMIDTILSDKKRMKAVEESLHIFLPKEPGGEEQTPSSQGAQSAIKKFFNKVGQMPQTQAQRMPQQAPGPKPNSPGGYMWSFPQMNPMQEAQQKILNDPAMAQDAALKSLGLPTAEDKMKTNAEIAKYDAEAQQADAHTKLYLEQVKQQGPIAEAKLKQAQAALIKANAYAAAQRAKAAGIAGGGANPAVVQAYVNRFATGELKNISQVPEKGGLRNSVVMGLGNVKIQQKFNATQQAAWDALPATENMLSDLDRHLKDLEKANPDAFKSDWWDQTKNLATAKGNAAIYKMGGLPNDPNIRQIIKDTAFISINGTMAFTRVGRNLKVFEQIQQHLPQIGDTPALIRDKANWLRANVVEPQKQSLTDYKYSGSVGGLSEWQQQQQRLADTPIDAPPADAPITVDPSEIPQ